jgi:hypothetical protein
MENNIMPFIKKSGGDIELTREDLFLLLESYKNNIEINTTLLDRINLILDGNRSTSDMIQLFLKNLTEVLKTINDTKECNQALYTEHLSKMEKQHGGIRTHIYILYVAIGAIVAPLLKMAYDTITHHAHIIQLLEKIAGILKIGIGGGG